MGYEKIMKEWSDPDFRNVRGSSLPQYPKYSLMFYERMPIADGMKIADVGCNNIKQ